MNEIFQIQQRPPHGSYNTSLHFQNSRETYNNDIDIQIEENNLFKFRLILIPTAQHFSPFFLILQKNFIKLKISIWFVPVLESSFCLIPCKWSIEQRMIDFFFNKSKKCFQAFCCLCHLKFFFLCFCN